MRTDETRASASPRSGALLLAFIAGLLGGAAAVVLLPGRSGPSEPAPSSGGLESLDQHVQELTRELSSLRAAAALPAPHPEASAGSPVESLRPSDVGLADVVARLDALLARAPAAGGLTTTPALVIPDASTTEAARLAFIRGDEGADTGLFLMSYQQVVERLGRPSTIWLHEDGRILWRYEDPSGNDSRTLTFIDGLVASLYY